MRKHNTAGLGGFMKQCEICGKEYIARGKAQKYCDECGPMVKRELARKRQAAYRGRKGCLVGVGSGNNQSGEKNHMWKGGVCAYRTMRNDVDHCERCGKPRSSASKWGFVTHHKDGDRTNNSVDNLEVLCKRCHQIEHHCEKNLPNKV